MVNPPLLTAATTGESSGRNGSAAAVDGQLGNAPATHTQSKTLRCVKS